MQAIRRSSCIILFCAIILLYINLLANLPVRLPFLPSFTTFFKVAELQTQTGKTGKARAKIEKLSAEVVDSNPYRCVA